jgi:hypothetical protein
LPRLDDLAARSDVENGDNGGRKLARALTRRTTALGIDMQLYGEESLSVYA